MRWIAFFALALATAFAPARAYTPESGVWWNPNEPGTGLQLELQDNLMTATVYAYDADGFQVFYTASDFLDDTATVFDADLFDYFGGACVGCAYTPADSLGEAGFIRIVFDELDPTRATMTWGLDGGPQRTVPIERYHFYLKRAEDGNAPVEVTKMLGEWNATFDLTEFADNDTGIQYFGEVMVIDTLDFDGGWFYEGCRPEHMVDGFCSTAALASTDLAGFYDSQFDIQIIVITDTRDQLGNPATCLYYDVRAGTNMFEGGIDDDFDGLDDGGVAVYPCPPGGTADPYDYDFFPVRGFRSASRTFVEDGVGPSKVATEAGVPFKTRGLPATTAKAPKQRSAEDQAKAAERLAIVRKLEARLAR